MPFFSIIIPTYNRAFFLSKAIESVINQTVQDWELIIVDDGSTDNTKNIVEIYSANDNRIKYIFQQNLERSAARNNGIRNANGEFICFLDSDDYYSKERLEGLYDFINNSTEKIALFYTGICFKKNEVITPRHELKNTFKNNLDFITQAIIGTPQTCIHKSILKKYLFNYDFKIGEDMELWLRIANEYPIVYIDKQFTIIASDHDDRSVDEKRFNSGAEQLKMLLFAFSPQHPGAKVSNSIQNKILSNAYFSIARHYLYNSSRWKSIRFLLRSIIQCPEHPQTKYKINILVHLVIGNTKKALSLI